jgi:L-asparaginase II
MVRHGLVLDPELLALACSSHSGEDFHLEGVRRILTGAGLTEADLQNTPDFPYDAQEQDRWRREGREKSSLAQNCSGKHAAMLATCVVNGWDTATYREPGHPLQQAISRTLAELTGDEITAVAVDGCGAPVMAGTLAGLARAFGRMAAAEPGTSEAEVADAIRANPAYLGGTGRDVTALVESTPGLIAKDGAESVYAVGLADGRGVAVKVADGYPRAKPVILAAVLRRIGVESPALAQLENSPVLGHGVVVGGIVAVNI